MTAAPALIAQPTEARAHRPVIETATGTAAAREPEGFWLGKIESPVPKTLSGGKVIGAKQLAQLLKSSAPVLVDVSSAPRKPDNLPASTPWLPLPHRAIPGALWIPGAGLGQPPAAVEQFYRDRLAKATGNDPERILVVYCHERCWLSWNGAKRAIRYGYHHVYWFPDGIEGWRKQNYPTAVVEPEPVP